MLTALLLQLAGAVLFSLGFFPNKNQPPSPNHKPTTASNYSPPFDRLVFVLIDALRELVRSGKARPYTAMAQAPTVTLPRIKALTTGSNPQFLDAVLNIQPDSMDQKDIKILETSDSWLRQLIHHPNNTSQLDQGKGQSVKRRALFYGDDTWLRLFPPDWFLDVDGVSSFFVSDTEIVDYNVTRHLNRVFSPIKRKVQDEEDRDSLDWDVLILHYLGLDHVGHLSGSKSDLMGPKQQQLDRVVQSIFQNISHFDAVENRNTLLVVTGDHGMTDAGNHGGSSSTERSTALLLASPFFNTHSPISINETIDAEVVQQVDIVPTLSILFGTEIPRGSIGVAIQSILNISFLDAKNSTPDFSTIRIKLIDHAVQITRLLQSVLGGGVDRTRQFLRLHPPQNQHDTLESILVGLDLDQLHVILHRSQDYLMTHFSGYNLPKMITGVIIMTIATILFMIQALPFFKDRNNNNNGGGGLNRLELLVLVFAILQIISFSSTSFIEEEHQSWFFLSASSTLFFALFSTSNRHKFLYLLSTLFLRILRGWSHNGQQISSVDGNSISRYLTGRPWLYHLIDPIGVYYIIHYSLSSTRFFGPKRREDVQFDSSTRIGTIFLVMAGLLSLTPMNRPFLYLTPIFSQVLDHPGFRARLLYGFIAFGISLSILFNKILITNNNNTHNNRHHHHHDEGNRKKFKLKTDIKLCILILSRSLTKPENYIVLWIALFASDLIHELFHNQLPQQQQQQQASIKGKTEDQDEDGVKNDHDCSSDLVATWVELVFIKSTFFALGGSNSLATVDLSNSFNGLKSFSLPLVTILTFLSNFSAPIIISLNLSLNNNNFHHPMNNINNININISYNLFMKKRCKDMMLVFRFCFFSFYFSFVCALSCLFLNHLFIFSVFSPLVLVAIAWFFAFNIFISFFF